MSRTADTHSIWADLVSSSKKAKGPIYTRYVNRNAAIPLTYLFYLVGLHPNTVSILSFMVTHSALLLLVLLGPSTPVAVGAYLLLALGFVMDSCDGQLARVSGKTSRLGAWLDHSLDIMKLLNLNMALGYLMIRHTFQTPEVSLGLVCFAVFLNLLSQPAHFFVINMKSEVLGEKAVSQFGNEGGAKRLMRIVLNIGDYGIFIMILLLLPWMDVFIPVYLAYGVYFLGLFALHFARTTWHVARQDEQVAEWS